MRTAKELLVPKHLSSEEFNLICDAFNGLLFSDELPLGSMIITTLIDVFEDSPIDKKWNVDAEALLSKISDFGELNYVLVYAILEFWNRLDDFAVLNPTSTEMSAE